MKNETEIRARIAEAEKLHKDTRLTNIRIILEIRIRTLRWVLGEENNND